MYEESIKEQKKISLDSMSTVQQQSSITEAHIPMNEIVEENFTHIYTKRIDLDLSKSESSFQENIEPSMHCNHQSEAQQLSHNIIICTNTQEQR